MADITMTVSRTIYSAALARTNLLVSDAPVTVVLWSFFNVWLHLQVKVGDTLDLIVEEDKEKDTVTLKRVVLKKIIGVTNDGEKQKVLLRSWKHLQLPKQDAFRE